jgi:hypothetical protein
MNQLDCYQQMTEDERELYFDMLKEYFLSDSEAVDFALEIVITQLVNRAIERSN